MPSFAWRTSVNKPFTLRVFDRYGAGGAPRDGGCDGARQQRLRPHGAETRETRGGLTRAEKRCYNLREICGD